MRSLPGFLRALTLLACALGCTASRPPPPPPQPAAPVDPFADLLLSDAGCNAPTPGVLRRADLLADLDVTERILSRGYAGWDAAAQSGTDWRASLGALRTAIARMPPEMPAENARALMVEHLQFTRDRHLGVWMMDEAGRVDWMACGAHQDAYATDVVVTRERGVLRVLASAIDGVPQGAALKRCDGKDVGPLLHRTVVGDALQGGYLLLKLANTAPAPMRCTFDVDGRAKDMMLAFHRLRSTSSEPRQGLPAVERHNGNVPRLRVRTLDLASQSIALSTFVSTARELREEQAVVLDVRGNGGGSDLPIRGWFEGITNTAFSTGKIDALVSDVTLQGHVNSARCDLLRAKDDTARTEMQSWLTEAETARTTASTQKPERAWRSFSAEHRGEAASPFRGALVVLADARCASSCESTIAHARQMERTLIVGENTAGTGTFGELMMYRLPRTQLGLSVPSKWFHVNGDDAGFEGRGHLPDIWIDSEDAANIAERLGVCLADVACSARLEAFAARASGTFIARVP